MRIQEIVLEGFKSYASRTVIDGFDEHFNAITGLNGSGKSNILDAICFVLGISTLATVRVTTRQEFVYKSGQAGITKANVTILFDNSDKTRCHEAYKKYDQISVRREYNLTGGGIMKCTINGTTVTSDKVLQLFSLSGLNVNNANFLIMQGRITQVINMKPQEILSLVEETAGTNSYEEIKKKTLRIVEKKEARLADINKILDTEVVPIMHQLQKENEEYIKWRSLCQEIELLEKKVKAATYYEIRDMLMNTEDIQQNYTETLRQMDKKQKHLENQVKELERQKAELLQRENSLIPEEHKRKYDGLKQEKDLADVQMARHKSEHIAWEAKRLGCLEDAEKNKVLQTRKANALQKANQDLEKYKENNEDLKKTLETFKHKLQTIERGGEINENFTEERINELERRRENLFQETNTKEATVSSLQKRLQARIVELSTAKSSETFDFTGITKQIADLEHQISQFSSFSEEQASLESEKSALESEIHNLSRRFDHNDQNRFALNYNLPEANFDRSKIKGRVIKLIKLKEEKYAKALESGAGSRLFSIVVDTDVTGQLLLQKRTFGNVSILPNNKTIPNIVPANIRQQAEKIFGNKARIALDLVEYNQENYNSIGFIFGHFFICETKEIASRIAYDPMFRRTAVTLDGDTYNPNGILSGGESTKKPSDLIEYYKFQEKEAALQRTQKRLSEVVKKIHEIEQKTEKVLHWKSELEVKKLQKGQREKALLESSSTRLASEIEEIEHLIGVTLEEIRDVKKQDGLIEKEVHTLKRQSISNPKDVLSKTIAKAEGDVKKSTEMIKRTQGHINELEGEIESICKEIEEMLEKAEELAGKIRGGNKEIEKLSGEIVNVNTRLQDVKATYENKLHELMRHKEIGTEVQENLEKSLKDLEKLKKEQQDIDTKRKTLQKESMNSLKILEELEAKHPYIPQMEAEIQNFDKKCACEHLEHLQSESDRQSKRVNKKVSSTLEDHEKRYNALTTKRELIMYDKGKLHDIISSLDERKQECIAETWKKVNSNLGEIYSMLLPGATAKLEPVDDLKGLEMQVAFNNDWKENLGELSGGQRSLLALSFILALLKYNPAPIYILDEIDAALDMSHTQNIGSMLSTHFSQSQFIVVSLKEGMFTNANVLYRTRFTDGKSVIERRALANNSADEAKKIKKYR